jgi:hypothetical protein
MRLGILRVDVGNSNVLEQDLEADETLQEIFQILGDHVQKTQTYEKILEAYYLKSLAIEKYGKGFTQSLENKGVLKLIDEVDEILKDLTPEDEAQYTNNILNAVKQRRVGGAAQNLLETIGFAEESALKKGLFIDALLSANFVNGNTPIFSKKILLKNQRQKSLPMLRDMTRTYKVLIQESPNFVVDIDSPTQFFEAIKAFKQLQLEARKQAHSKPRSEVNAPCVASDSNSEMKLAKFHQALHTKIEQASERINALMTSLDKTERDVNDLKSTFNKVQQDIDELVREFSPKGFKRPAMDVKQDPALEKDFKQAVEQSKKASQSPALIIPENANAETADLIDQLAISLEEEAALKVKVAKLAIDHHVVYSKLNRVSTAYDKLELDTLG